MTETSTGVSSELISVAVRSIHAMANGERAEFDALYHPAATDRENAVQPPASRVQGPDCFWSTAQWLRAAFAGLHYDIHHALTDGDLVAVSSTMNGEHAEPWACLRRVGRDRHGLPADPQDVRGDAVGAGSGCGMVLILERWANRDWPRDGRAAWLGPADPGVPVPDGAGSAQGDPVCQLAADLRGRTAYESGVGGGCGIRTSPEMMGAGNADRWLGRGCVAEDAGFPDLLDFRVPRAQARGACVTSRRTAQVSARPWPRCRRPHRAARHEWERAPRRPGRSYRVGMPSQPCWRWSDTSMPATDPPRPGPDPDRCHGRVRAAERRRRLRARGRGAGTGGRPPEQRRDRASAVHLGPDGREPCLVAAAQARGDRPPWARRPGRLAPGRDS